MKKIIISLGLLIALSGCLQNTPPAKIQCWQHLASNAFPFVISTVNICDGPAGGSVKYTVIKPIFDFINKRNMENDRMMRERIKLKRMEKLY